MIPSLNLVVLRDIMEPICDNPLSVGIMRKRIRLCVVCLLLTFVSTVHAQENITQSRNNAIIEAVQKVSPSVVNLKATHEEKIANPYWGPFVIPRRREVHGLGSGIVIEPTGYILTNQHVIANAQKIEVTLADGRKFDATVVGEDYLADLALLKVNGQGLPSAALGDSDDILIGEWAIAIGNPFASFVRDPQPTVTVGVISAQHRVLKHEDRFYYGLLQTDASINPGNSGGALVNSQGQVIGVNTAIFSTSGGSQGLGFAIPINIAKKIIKKLQKYGMALEPQIGMEYQELSANIAEYLELNTEQGVVVSQVHEDTLADRAGIRRLDVIQTVDGRSIDTVDELLSVLRLPDSGDTIQVKLLREGEPQTLRIKVDRLPDVEQVWGLTLVDVKATSYMSRYRRSGALVVRVAPNSSLSDIKMGDLIYGFSKQPRESHPARSLEELTKFVRKQKSGSVITIHLERNGRDYYIPNWRVP